MIQTHLTVTPSNYEKWELTNHEGLELVRYEFAPSQLVGSAGTQEWIFMAQTAGSYQITFKRNNETKQVSVRAYNDMLWCGKREPLAPIFF